jgi:hypothetical protein
MVTKAQSAVDHTRQENVGDIFVASQHQIGRLILGMAMADTGVRYGGRHFFFFADSFGGALDGIDYLLVTGAATKVGREGFGDLVPGRFVILVDKGIGLDHHAGDAETTLNAAFTDESIGENILPVFAQPLDGRHPRPGGLFHRRDACQDRLAV